MLLVQFLSKPFQTADNSVSIHYMLLVQLKYRKLHQADLGFNTLYVVGSIWSFNKMINFLLVFQYIICCWFNKCKCSK